jgi:hypothetical protein
LILRYIQEHLPKVDPKYSLEYETRPGSAAYLDVPVENRREENIDFFHMHAAWVCIRDWFAEQDDVTLAAINFYKYLSESVYIIWYEAPDDVDSTALFTRLNVGRIPLTDAELVKALLLTRASAKKREHEVAAQWDAVERDLRVPELWAFVTARPQSEATHINLLLDTLAGGPTGRQRPLFHTFETLRPMIENDAQGTWNTIVALHSLILGWYDDRDTFHKIGYLIARGRTVAELVTLSNDVTKGEFDERLDGLIRGHLAMKRSDLAELHYRSAKTMPVLLLMNVETVRRMKHSSERFSFKEHATKRWSIEHIHAQNAEQLNRAAQWKEWLRLQRDALAGLPKLGMDARKELTERINAALEDITAEAFTALEQELTVLFSLADESGDIDAIANLALLASDDNSALSNSVFEVKRRHVLERDRNGSYIPVCTRNVFLKYYTDAEGQQNHFWGQLDRDGYLAAMYDYLDPYLLADED